MAKKLAIVFFHTALPSTVCICDCNRR